MGVTTVQSHPLREYTLATGSYDEVVSIWDKRLMSGRANPVAQRGTEGGGVWRIKWHPHDPHLFALAAMHRGFFVMEWSGGNSASSHCCWVAYVNISQPKMWMSGYTTRAITSLWPTVWIGPTKPGPREQAFWEVAPSMTRSSACGKSTSTVKCTVIELKFIRHDLKI